MKPAYKKLSPYLLAAALGATALIPSCKNLLDVPNRGVIVPEAVWGDKNMIGAFLNDIYAGLMPGWPFNGSETDEGFSTPKSLGNYHRGIISVTATISSLNYAPIEKINFFLDKLETVPSSVLSDDLKKQYTGEALFWRAWAYWGMVQLLGGVPLILKPQNATDVNSLFVPRNKTSECLAQIVKDLDNAISFLPGVYANAANDYGRITKVAAMAVKGRVLMAYASPLFNPSNSKDRWQAAFDANKAAVDFAVSQGHQLHPNFQKIWYEERNKEVIMVNQYAYPTHPINFNVIRPEPLTKDASNNNQPLLSLLLAFPKKDGTPMQFDKDQLADDAYNAQFLTDFYTNRDDRFYATVFFGGEPYPTPDEVSPTYIKGNSFWNVWKRDASGRFVNILSVIHPAMPGNPGYTGFFQLKGLDVSLTQGLVNQGQTDWIEIRFAEVYLNYAECANEIGSTSAAIEVMKEIRKRAGIAAGNGNYGITANPSSQPEVREALIKERQAEFAFENKRFGDLRRWKRYDILNSQGARHGLYITVKDINNLPAPSDNIKTASVRDKFRAYYIDNLDGDPTFKFNLDLNHWFFSVPPNQITQSKNILIQNKEWGGEFDPLQ